MKKLLLRISLAVLLLLLLGALALSLSINGIIKRGVETVGPKLTDATVKLDAVSLSPFSGAGSLSGLLVGNPEGFKSPAAIQVGKAMLSLKPSSIFGDKVIIKSIRVQEPEITFETDLKGNNLSKLLANVKAATGGADSSAGKPAAPPTAQDPKANRKLQVDDFLLSGAKLHVSLTVLGGKSATVALPDIHLTDLGAGPDGITAAELTRLVLQAVEKEAITASASSIGDLTKDAAGLTKGLGKDASGAAEKLSKGIGGLFNKK